MADREFLNDSFIQLDDICVLACYGIVIEYFSDGSTSVGSVLDSYVESFDVKYFKFGPNKRKKKHKEINRTFHKLAWEENARGFDVVAKLHNDDVLGTRSFCDIISNNADTKSISRKELEDVRLQLENHDALAMVLYPSGEKKMHAVVVGYDTAKEQYFVKDPEKKEHLIEDILDSEQIWEYIIFNDPEE